MMDATLCVIFLILVTTVSSNQVSLTCTDTVQGRLKTLDNCTLNENIVVCGSFRIRPGSKFWNISSFSILEQVRNITQFCLGFINFTRSGKITQDRYFLDQTLGFNSSLAVGVLTVEPNCWKAQRSSSCLIDVSILEHVLELGIIKYIPEKKEFWSFTSTLYDKSMGWLQLLHVYVAKGRTRFISSDWIINLQNTSIRNLAIKCATCAKETDGLLLKDMPYLEKLDLSWVCIEKFHRDIFTGTPNLKNLKLIACDLKSIPDNINRLKTLKDLDISYNLIKIKIIEDKNLPQLQNLEYLNIAGNNMIPVLDKFPVLSNLKYLILSSCELTTLEKDAFRNISSLVMLDLSHNNILDIHKGAFISLHNLKILNLRNNILVTWPVIYFCSLLTLDISWNQIMNLSNPSVTGTTMDNLYISYNFISEWNDMNIFSYNGDGLSKRKMFLGNDNQEVNSLKPFSFITNNTVNYNNNRYQYKTLKKYHYILKSMSKKKWVKSLDISGNRVSRFTNIMLKSMDDLDMIKLNYNPLDCRDCTIPQFQKWINTTETKIIEFSNIQCSEPLNVSGKPVTEINFDLDACVIKPPNYLILAGIPLGIVFSIFLIITSVYFRFKSLIIYMLQLRKTRKHRTTATYKDCNFDAFVCYSGHDRRFVLKVLAPFIESCPERYKLCLHERDFALGSRIVDNILGAIEHSRKTILILSLHFIKSKWCKWELEMANHKMFDDDKQFLILIQVANIEPDIIPHHLMSYMRSRTFLNWMEDASESDVEEMREQLKRSLGKSIYQNTNERAPLVPVPTAIGVT